MKVAASVFFLLLFISHQSLSQDAKAILEKSYYECTKVKGGSFRMMITRKAFTDTIATVSESNCKFLKIDNDSVSPWKFFIKKWNGDGALCTGNELIRLRAKDSSGVIYSRNHSEYETAIQDDGLFLPVFQPRIIFNLDRLNESTIVLRISKDEEVMKKNCYVVHVIDVSRFARPNSERQEKVFFVDKQTYLPLGYSEINVAKVAKDSLVKSEEFKIVELNISDLPHDSVFTYKSVQGFFQLRTMTGGVYHHHLKAGMKAPDFSGKLIGGDTLSLESLRGKKVLLYFFSHSSYPSLKALSEIQNLGNINKDVTVLLISMDRGERDIADLLKRRNITLKVISRAQSVADSYFINAAPTFIVIDAKGIIKHIETGYGEKTTEKLLNDLK